MIPCPSFLPMAPYCCLKNMIVRKKEIEYLEGKQRLWVHPLFFPKGKVALWGCDFLLHRETSLVFWGPHQVSWFFYAQQRQWASCKTVAHVLARDTLVWEVFGESGSGQLRFCQTLEWALRMDFASQDPRLLLTVIWPSLLWTLLHASWHFLHPAVCRPGTQEMPNVREFYGWFTAVLTLFEERWIKRRI